jgi:polyisoprenoid-binding protein YceI
MPVRKFAVVLLLFTLLLSACGLLRDPEAASGPIEAVPLEVGTDTPQAAEADSGGADATALPAQEAAPTEPSDTIAAATPTTEAAAAEGAGPQVYEISQADSEVRFELEEDLRGERTQVVGITDQVAGQIALNLEDLSTVQVGVIQINARTLLTDNNFRNRAIQNEILDTGAYEFITFTPTAVNDLPASAAVGDELSFTIDGALTIRDITQPVTFAVTATAASETRLTGSATATVARADFDLRIPQVRNVANVDEEVVLFIDFVADAT